MRKFLHQFSNYSNFDLPHSDPNTPNSASVRGNNQFFIAPNQSKSFRILQAVTGTMGEESDENEAEQRQIDQQPMVEQGAIYSRPLANENDRAYMKQMSRGAQGECRISI